MWLFKALCVIAAVFSLVMLAKIGFALGSFVAPLQVTIDYYDSWMRLLFGWADPYLKVMLTFIGNWIGWKWTLHPHWKHVFVLMWLYFGADARTYWARGKRAFSCLTIIWGGFVALVASVASGVATIGGSSGNTIIAALPIGGVAVYELGIIGWKVSLFRSGASGVNEAFRSGMVSFLLPALLIGVGTLTIGAYFQTQMAVQQSKDIGIALLAGFVVGLAVFRLVRGVWTATFDRDAAERWFDRFKRSGSTRIAILMLTSILGALAFILANAGLRFCGV